jgi:hypothetical protein
MLLLVGDTAPPPPTGSTCQLMNELVNDDGSARRNVDM